MLAVGIVLFFFQAEDGIRDYKVTGVQTCALPIYYVWEGEMHATPEWRLVCKTLPDVLERLARLLRAGHSYSVPQITMRTERCMADYAQWLRSQVSTRDVADTAEMAAAPRITAA